MTFSIIFYAVESCPTFVLSSAFNLNILLFHSKNGRMTWLKIEKKNNFLQFSDIVLQDPPKNLATNVPICKNMSDFPDSDIFCPYMFVSHLQDSFK